MKSLPDPCLPNPLTRKTSMNIDSFKKQHVQILTGIATLRRYAQEGIKGNAESIANEVVMLSSVIKVHLAIEDRVLYPSLQKNAHPELAAMGRSYQNEMKDIANAYAGFSRRWNTASQVSENEDDFRRDANTVLKQVHQRMQKENREFYPAIEAV